MGTRAVRQGPTSERVAANVKRLRDEQRLTLDQLSKRLGEVGRPILASGLSKIEQGDRRVDVDDLVALALALEVNPNALLMPEGADASSTALTETVTATAQRAWRWAAGDSSLNDHTHRTDRGIRVDNLEALARWSQLTSPYKSEEERWDEVKGYLLVTAKRRRADDGQR